MDGLHLSPRKDPPSYHDVNLVCLLTGYENGEGDGGSGDDDSQSNGGGNNEVPPRASSESEPLEEMAEDVIDLLDEDPTRKEPAPFQFHEQLASRWNYSIRFGNKKESKAKLLEKYPRVGNCILDAWAVNPECEQLMKEPGKKKDRYYTSFQKSTGSALVGVGTAVSMLMAKSAEPLDRRKLFTLLYDAGSILTDLQHTFTLGRREMIYPLYDKKYKEILGKPEASEGLLFGPELGAKLKAAQVAEKMADSVKVASSSFKKPGSGNAQDPQGQGANRAGKVYRKPYNNQPRSNNNNNGNFNNFNNSRPRQQQHQQQ